MNILLTKVPRSLASSLSSREKRSSDSPERNGNIPAVKKPDQLSTDDSSLDSQPYTGCHPVSIENVSVYSGNSVYSQKSTSLAYLREASVKSVRMYWATKPEVVSPKRGRISRARLFLFPEAKKTVEQN